MEMKRQKTIQFIFGSLVVFLTIIACSSSWAPGVSLVPQTSKPANQPAGQQQNGQQDNGQQTNGKQAAGITSPVSVGGYKLQLITASENDDYTINGEHHRPTFKEDTFLIINGNLSPAGVDAVGKWEVSVTDSDGKKSPATIRSWWTKDKNDALGGRIEWVFLIPKSGSGFILNLPEGIDIPLATLMKQ
jgi:hypothetical protein